MKHILVYIVIASNVLIMLSQNAIANISSMTVLVVDENGKPMEGADVSVEFIGEGIGHGSTDSSGKYRYEGPFNFQAYAGAKKAGYYPAQSQYVSFKSDKEGRGQPWNPIVTITMKRMIDPHPMAFGWIPNIPEIDKGCAFDFLKSDWLPPHGNGNTCDALITLSGWRSNENGRVNYKRQVTVEFPGSLNGLLAYEGQKISESRKAQSVMRSPATAADKGYMAAVKWIMGCGQHTNSNGEKVFGYYGNIYSLGGGNNYMFRIRTVTNDAGNIIDARYGKIEDVYIDWRAGWPGRLCGEYFVNMTSNRSLEHLMGPNFQDNVPLRAWPGPEQAYDKAEEEHWIEQLSKLKEHQQDRKNTRKHGEY